MITKWRLHEPFWLNSGRLAFGSTRLALGLSEAATGIHYPSWDTLFRIVAQMTHKLSQRNTTP
jgi:hypothetical protein